MAEIIDTIVTMALLAMMMALALYKLFLWFRYRNDPVKREALISSGQLYPKRLAKWIFDEDANTGARRLPSLNLSRK